MKKFIFLIPPLIVIVSFLLFFFWWRNATLPANGDDPQPRDFLIVRGRSAEQIGKKLEEEGFIRSWIAFKLYTQFTGKAKQIQAGEYRLSRDKSLQQIVLALISGPEELWVTYPEGFRREEIAIRTIEVLEIQDEEAEVFWQEFLAQTEKEEGFLFPDTYLFPRDVEASEVAEKLRSIFGTKVTDQMIKDAREAGLTMEEVVTMASIVERETRTGEERPVVAGILLKRLEAGWPLQADATLQYILATQQCGKSDTCLSRALSRDGTSSFKWWDIPTAQHRQTLKSPYNTYLNPGLPPGPIANPGLNSIKAVIYPEESPYWFYLHDKDGKIRYAETVEEHNENIEKYLR